jgi:hypothetical protein
MIDYKAITIITSIVALWLLLSFLDAKYRFSFVKWINGETSNPFAALHSKENAESNSSTAYFSQGDCAHEDSETKHLKAQIKVLKERVQVLEKIVTEPTYELNRELNNLANDAQ